MARYVLLSRDPEPSDEDLSRIAATPGVTILDQTLSRAMLLEATDQAAAELRSGLPRWIVSAEVEYLPPG